MNTYLHELRPYEDAASVNEFYRTLQNAGFEPWMDLHSLIGGMDWEAIIQQEIKQSDIFLVFLSARSIVKRGVFQKEIAFALSRAQEHLKDDIYIIPIRLDECEIPRSISRYHCIEGRDMDCSVMLIQAIIRAAKQRSPSGITVLDENISFPVVLERIKETFGLSQIDYMIPRLVRSSSGVKVREINELVAGIIRMDVLQFRSEIVDREADNSERASYMESGACISLASKYFYSLHISTHFYYAGATHSLSKFDSINIFVPTMTMISLRNIFDQRSGYLKMLEETTVIEIPKQIGGPGPGASYFTEPSSFDQFTINKRGLTFLFNQVPRVFGPGRLVDISREELKPLLSTTTVAQQLVLTPWETVI